MTDASVASRVDVRVEASQKRVRVYLAGELVAATPRPLLVWERPYYPTYYIPMDAGTAELMPTGRVEHSLHRGDGEVYDVRVSRLTASGAAMRFPESPHVELRDAVRLEWDAMGEWFEEDEPVYTHARDPHTRVDILASSRHIRVELDGVTVADSHRPSILFETGLPARYYLPLTDVRLELLRPSDKQTHCPYKGPANSRPADRG